MTDEIEVGEIVQLSPSDTKNKLFSACLMVVTDIKSWGVQGYVQNAGQDGQAFYRAETGTFERTGGKAVWIIE